MATQLWTESAIEEYAAAADAEICPKPTDKDAEVDISSNIFLNDFEDLIVLL